MVSPELRKVLDLELPTFVTFGPPRPPRTIRSENGRIVIDECPGDEFETVGEAYDSCSGDRANYRFDDSLINDGYIQFKGDILADEGGRTYTTNSDERDVFLLKLRYYNFLMYTNLYREDRDDWVHAYQWLQNHPVFWHVHEDLPYRWLTDHGLADIRITAGYRDDGTTFAVLEHGPYLGTPKSRASHDEALDVTGMDFEDAFVKLAKVVDTRYHLDGGRRRNILPPE